MSGQLRAAGFFALAGGVGAWVLLLYSENLLWTGMIGLAVAFFLFALVGRRL